MENFAQKLSVIIAASTLLEAVITYFSEFFIDGVLQWKVIASIIFGIAISLTYKLDLPCYLSISNNITIIGQIITGILISRGSNFIHDLISKLS